MARLLPLCSSKTGCFRCLVLPDGCALGAFFTAELDKTEARGFFGAAPKNVNLLKIGPHFHYPSRLRRRRSLTKAIDGKFRYDETEAHR
jgi:hypothetical protein